MCSETLIDIIAYYDSGSAMPCHARVKARRWPLCAVVRHASPKTKSGTVEMSPISHSSRFYGFETM